MGTLELEERRKVCPGDCGKPRVKWGVRLGN